MKKKSTLTDEELDRAHKYLQNVNLIEEEKAFVKDMEEEDGQKSNTD